MNWEDELYRHHGPLGLPFHFWTFFVAIFGAMTGSFLNVVIHRVPRMMEAEWQAQAAELRARLVARGFAHVVSHRDLAGHERVTEGRWLPAPSH